MKSYKRPIVLVHEELAEGVYAASGAIAVNYFIQYNKLILPDVSVGEKVIISYTDGTTQKVTYQCGGISLGCSGKEISNVFLAEEEEDDNQCSGGSSGGWKPWPGHWWW